MAADENRAKLSVWFACIITAAWTVSFVIDIVDRSYDAPPSVHALMLIVAGGLFGESIARRGGGNGVERDHDDDRQ